MNGDEMSEREQIELSGSEVDEFPFMMYHPKLPPATAGSLEEMKSMTARGWRRTPISPSAEEHIRSKIKALEAELEVLYEELKAIEESKRKKTNEEKQERVEKAKETLKTEGKEIDERTCSKCGRVLDTVEGKNFHEMKCRGKNEKKK
jgi:ElaB/YqjD/DUF883 family membrane-anchored ribosome-binding protein